MKKRYLNKATALLMAVVIFFTSNSLLLTVFAVENELPLGVGIYHHVMTAGDSAEAKYVVKFYHTDENGAKTLVPFSTEMQIEGAKYLTPNNDGTANNSAYIYLEKNEKLVFSDSAAFNQYIKNNSVDTIEITYVTEQVDLKDTSLLYSDRTRTYSFVEQVTQTVEPGSALLDRKPGAEADFEGGRRGASGHVGAVGSGGVV